MKQKLIGMSVAVGVFLVLVVLWVLTKGTPAKVQAKEKQEERKVLALAEEKGNLPPGRNDGKKETGTGTSAELDLEGLDPKGAGGQDLEEKQVTFLNSRIIRDRATNRIKGLSLLDEQGCGYVFWNESEGTGFKNGILPRGFSLRKQYTVRGKKDRPYRGNPQFQVKEFAK